MRIGTLPKVMGKYFNGRIFKFLKAYDFMIFDTRYSVKEEIDLAYLEKITDFINLLNILIFY